MGTDYITWANTGTYDCREPIGGIGSVSAAVDSELQKIAKIPTVETSEVKSTNGTLTRGYLYFPSVTIDGIAGRVMMIYTLEGSNQNCGVPGVLTYTNVGQIYTISGATNTNRTIAGITSCYVALAEV